MLILLRSFCSYIKLFIIIGLCVFTTIALNAQVRTDFITRWKTDNPGVSNSNQITIPFQSNLPLNYRVIWGDGTTSTNVTSTTVTHTYASPGTYTVSIVGLTSGGAGLSSFRFADGGDRLKLLSIEQWGNNEWEMFISSFSGCENLVINATDRPVFGLGANCSAMFKNCKSLNQSINHWNVIEVRDMSEMFLGCMSFNRPLNNWNVAKVANFARMFEGCTAFNQSLASWEPLSLLTSARMFTGATAFNSPLWTRGSNAIGSMNSMFENATLFNQPIGFSTENCQDFSFMFSGASSFNQSLANFTLANLVVAASMLDGCNMSLANYEATLTSWAAKPKRTNVRFGAGGRRYCATGATARNTLINSSGWTISGDESATTTFSLIDGAGKNIATACTGTEMEGIKYEVKNIGARPPTASGLPPGVSLQVVGNQLTIAGIPTTTGVYNYTVSGIGVCGTAQATGTVTVRTGGQIVTTPPANISTQTICAGSAITPISWVTNAGVKSVRFANLPNGINSSFQNNTITLSGTPSGSGVITMQAFYSDDCREQLAAATVTIRPAAAVQLTSGAGTNQLKTCPRQPITSVTYQSNTGQVQVSGLPFGLTAQINSGNVTISGTLITVGTYNYTVTAISDCGNSTPFAGSIQVQAAPAISAVPAITPICAGGTTQRLNAFANGGGLVNAIWSDGGLGGTFTFNSGNTPVLTTYTPPADFTGTVSLSLIATGSSCTTIRSQNLEVLYSGTATWLGLTNNWAAPTNWSNGAVPGKCAHVVIPVTTQNPLIQGTSNRVSSITVQSGATVSLANGASLVVER